MIQQKELRVGNYVHVPSLDSELYEVSTISRYGKDCSVTDNKLGYQSSVLDIENVNAIPLTDEWVVSKLGFEKQNFHFYFHPQMGGMFLRTPFINADRYYLKTNMGDNVTVVKFVHQLQNIFFSITGEDLVIKND